VTTADIPTKPRFTQVNLLVGLGYKRLAAQAKVAYDVVLLAMFCAEA